jgi:chloramphenicol-sensitive protein RarD
MQASLGYFLNPLLNVGLGMIFLNERFDFFQGCALALAGIGVGVLVGFYGEIPVLALFLAVTFAFYGLLRKVINCNPVIGLFIEMLFVLPFGLIYAYYLNQRGDLVFGLPFDHLDFHLFLTGIITVFPLAIFAAAVKRLSFIAVGLLQYIAPTGQFLLAVIVFKEEFTVAHKITFTLIWLGLILYSYRNFTNQRALARILKEQRATN